MSRRTAQVMKKTNGASLSLAQQQQPDSEGRSELLTAREMEILELIDLGLTNQQIATRLSLALHTVKNHVHNLLTKLGVGTRAEAASMTRALRYSNAAEE